MGLCSFRLQSQLFLLKPSPALVGVLDTLQYLDGVALLVPGFALMFFGKYPKRLLSPPRTFIQIPSTMKR